MMTRIYLGLGLVLLAACGGESPVAPPPPPDLRDVESELREIVAQAPPPPTDERMIELRGLLEAAFVPGAADARLAARAKTNLLEQDDAAWILEEGLQHELVAVRSNAAFQLGQLGAGKASASVVPLAKRLKYEREPECLMWIAGALASLHNHAGLDALASVLADGPRAPPAATRQQAGEIAISILQVSGPAVADRPSYAELQRELDRLARAWRRTGTTPGDTQVPDALTRGRIAELVVILRDFQLRPVDDARFVLARLGSLGLPALRLTTRARNNYLRNHGLEVLRDLGASAAGLADDVLPLLGDEISAPYAAQALGTLGDSSAAPLLIDLLRNPALDLRTAICGALGPLGNPVAIPPLRRVLRDEKASLDERVYAAFSLALLEDWGEGLAFLEARLAADDYHAPTLRELIDRAR